MALQIAVEFLYDTEDLSVIVVLDEFFCLFGITQIIAAREEAVNLLVLACVSYIKRGQNDLGNTYSKGS